jgi:hypothetical protein
VILGLGREEVPLSIQDVRGPDAPAREWISVGDPRRKGSVDFFYLGGDVSEMEERQLVHFETALRAALDFVRTGMVPSNVKWEDHSLLAVEDRRIEGHPRGQPQRDPVLEVDETRRR